MDDVVKSFYLRGDAAALVAIVRCADERQEDDRGAYRALKLLARLGEPEAAEFCHGAGPRDPSAPRSFARSPNAHTAVG
jgi:hypothetical protein